MKSDFDESVARLLEQEKILLSILGQAKAKLESSRNETEIDKWTKFIDEGLKLIKSTEEMLEMIFGPKRVTGNN